MRRRVPAAGYPSEWYRVPVSLLPPAAGNRLPRSTRRSFICCIIHPHSPCRRAGPRDYSREQSKGWPSARAHTPLRQSRQRCRGTRTNWTSRGPGFENSAAPREGGDPTGNKGEQGWGRGGAEPGGAGANRGRDQEDLGAGPNWGWSLSG